PHGASLFYAHPLHLRVPARSHLQRGGATSSRSARARHLVGRTLGDLYKWGLRRSNIARSTLRFHAELRWAAYLAAYRSRSTALQLHEPHEVVDQVHHPDSERGPGQPDAA